MNVQQQLVNSRYALVREVGRGGMATVWEAHDTLLDRRVAIKLLHPQLAADPEFRERFRREARAAAQLSHPTIVGVFDVGTDQATGTPFIITELIEGGNLKERIRRDAPLPDAVVREVGTRIADGLHLAHTRGFVHRDVKPQNILLDQAGAPRIGDFGIVQALGAGGLTRTGGVMGSVHYLAPEVARGQPATPASDVYSLGAVLYEMATGRQPFTGETDVAVALAHLQEPVVPPSRLNPRLAADLEATILRALAKDPSQRFASAADFATALRNPAGLQPTARVSPVADEPTRRVVAPPPAPVPVPARRVSRPEPVPRNGPGGAPVLLVLAALLVGLGVAVYGIASFGGERAAVDARPTAPPTAAVKPTTAPAKAPPTATAVEAAKPAEPTPLPTVQPTAVPAKPTAPPPTAPPAKPTTPTAPPAAAGDPAETIQTHYTLIDARRYEEGHAIMSAKLRRQFSVADYSGWFVNKVRLQPVSITTVAQDASRAVVDTVVESTDRVNGQEVQQQVAERFILVLEDGAWRIDQVTRL